MIKTDNSNIVGVSLGNTQFSKIYKGIDLYWRKKPIDISDFIIPKDNAVIGDIVLWDKVNEEKIVVNPTNLKKFGNSNYSPIGVVIINSNGNYSSDNIYVMAYRFGSYKTPKEGKVTTTETAKFGFFGQNIGFYESVISNKFNCVNIYKDSTQSSINQAYCATNQCYLPSDINNSGTICLVNDNLKYLSSSNMVPPPFKNDGSINVYYKTFMDGTYRNGLYDIKGWENTQNILNKCNIPNWQTTESLTSGTAYNGIPAWECWKYQTEGTNQGDWYMPSAGELGNIVYRSKLLNESLQKIKEVFNIDVITLNGSYYHSSTEDYYSTYRTFLISGTGAIYKDDGRYTENKDKSYNVIPIMKY